MELEQQQLLRTLFAELKMTRGRFCEKYEVSIRALGNWLLPNDSSGFRRMPFDIKYKVTNDLIEVLNSKNIKVSAIEYDDKNKGDLVTVLRCGEEIIFPKLYFFKGLYLWVHLPFYPNRTKKPDSNGQYVQERITFQPEKLAEDVKLRNFNYGELNKAKTINGEAYWMYLVHYRSIIEAQAAAEALKNVSSDLDDLYNFNLIDNIQIASFNDSYFLSYMKKAPAWHNLPLIIYGTKGLDTDFFGNIIYNSWEMFVNEEGKVVSKPLPSE